MEDADDIPGKPGNNKRNKSADTEIADDDLGSSRSLGSVNGQMGALNAAHAAPVALERAAASSRVGRIAAYKAGLVSLGDSQTQLDEAREVLDELSPPDRPLSEIRADLRDARVDVRDARSEVARLEEALEEAGGTDADIEADLEEARSSLREARQTRNEVRGELRDAVDYNDAVDTVADLEDQVLASEAEALELLRSAANKPLNNNVIAEVNRLLGLEDVVLVLPEEEDDSID